MEESSQKNPALSPAQYWEWRTTVTELQMANIDNEKALAELKLLQKETEICAIRAQLYSLTRVEAAKAAAKAAQAEYERYTKVLEDALGVSLKNKIIDDVSYEIKGLPETK